MTHNLSIGIVHMTYKILGGAELLSVSSYKALKEKYKNVKIITTYLNTDDIERIFDIRIPQSDVIVYNPNIRTPLYSKLPKTMKHLIKIKKFYKKVKNEFEINILIDTYSNLPVDYDITYIHFPFIHRLVYENFYPSYYRRLIQYLLNKWFDPSPQTMYLTNSTWTAKKIYKYVKIVPKVLYPPLMTSRKYDELASPPKEDIIITISRISPEKRLEEIIAVAKLIKKYNFIIVGTISDENYYHRLLKTTKENEIDNIRLFVNLPRNELVRLLRRARIYLHPPYAEHFGLSVIEAISYDCIPLVFYNSGSCTDIVSKIDHELCYERMQDITYKLKYISDNYEKILTNMKRIISYYSFDNFKKKLADLIDYIIELKSG